MYKIIIYYNSIQSSVDDHGIHVAPGHVLNLASTNTSESESDNFHVPDDNMNWNMIDKHAVVSSDSDIDTDADDKMSLAEDLSKWVT